MNTWNFCTNIVYEKQNKKRQRYTVFPSGPTYNSLQTMALFPRWRDPSLPFNNRQKSTQKTLKKFSLKKELNKLILTDCHIKKMDTTALVFRQHNFFSLALNIYVSYLFLITFHLYLLFSSLLYMSDIADYAKVLTRVVMSSSWYDFLCCLEWNRCQQINSFK